MNIDNMYSKLRRYNKGSYKQFKFCVLIAVVFITSFSVILFSPMIQNTFPEGGDSRKQIDLIFAVTFIGCWVFVIYALTLFLRYKSKEIGIQLALGAKKSQIAKYLSKEVRRITVSYTIIGIVLGIILSFFLWETFRNLFVDGSNYDYIVSKNGIAILLLFVIAIMITASTVNKRYMEKSNLLNFIYEQQTSETLKIIGKPYGICGLFFMVLGIVLGYIVPILVAYNSGKNLPGVWGITYIFTVIGIYMCMVYAVMGFNKGKNKQKYYKTILSKSMMKFQGKQTVKNMCVITLMVVAGLFAFFYIPQLRAGVNIYMQSKYDISIPTRADLSIISKEKILNMAEKYNVQIIDYNEIDFSELLGSGIERDWDDENNLIENYEEYYKYYEFISEDVFEKITGKDVNVQKGKYILITSSEANESFWVKNDDLDLVTNSINNKQISIKYQDTVQSVCLLRNGVNRYVLNNEDYLGITVGLDEANKVQQTLFSLMGNTEDKYAFSVALYEQLLEDTPENCAVVSSYDKYQEKKTEDQGKEYYYSDKLDLNPDNTDLMSYWKYYPIIKPIVRTEYQQSTMAYFLVFIYAGLICMIAVAIIENTRTKMLAINNRKYFHDLNKLGAGKEYLQKCFNDQVKRIYILPSCMGSLLILLFTLIILRGNDNKFSGLDFQILAIDFFIVILMAILQYVIFKVSMLQAKKILHLPD